MKNQHLIDKYKKFYTKILELIKDREIFPELDDRQFQEFVSQEDWMGVPSFSVSKKEMTNSDEGHIGIWVHGSEATIDLWFKGD